jgi:DNA-binding CsgD family transcriptional regulator
MAKATLNTLEKATEAAEKARQGAEDKLARRDSIALALADQGVTYAELAKAMNITPDGVTYVLRKVRARKS